MDNIVNYTMEALDYGEEEDDDLAIHEDILITAAIEQSKTMDTKADIEKKRQEDFEERIKAELNEELSGLEQYYDFSFISLQSLKKHLERHLQQVRLMETTELKNIKIHLLEEKIVNCSTLMNVVQLKPINKINKILEKRSLKLTSQGNFLTKSGKLYSKEHCEAEGLLDNLEEEYLRMHGIQKEGSGHYVTLFGKSVSSSKLEEFGIHKEFNIDDFLEPISFASGTPSSTSASTLSESTMSAMSTCDVHYLKNELGRPLTLALAEIASKQPRDPIHYLAHWLFKYRYNQEIDQVQKDELEALIAERERLAIIALHDRSHREAKLTLIDLLGRVESQIKQREIEAELRRIEEESRMMAENENLEMEEARDTLGVYDGPTAGAKL